MGLVFSKLRLPGNVEDSLVLCDGLPPLKDAQFATLPGGRFVFTLGDERVASSNCESVHLWTARDDATLALTYSLDVIDTLLSKRNRLISIGDIYGAGKLVGFYALDECTVVLIHIAEGGRVLCQRVVRFDCQKSMAECCFDRRYTIPLFASDMTVTYVDQGTVATFSYYDAPITGFTYPSNPLSSKPIKDLAPLFLKANGWLNEHHEEGATVARVSPFSFSDGILGVYVKTADQEENSFHSSYLLFLNTVTEEMALRDFPDEAFDAPDNALNMHIKRRSRAGGAMVALVARFPISEPCWRFHAAAMISLLIDGVCAVSDLVANTNLLAGHAEYWKDWIVDRLSVVQMHILNPNSEPHLRFGIINFRTMEWTRIEPSGMEDPRLMIPYGEGRFLVASKTRKVGRSRPIGGIVEGEMERMEIIRDPRRMPSLKQLATVVVQRSGRVAKEELKMVGARIE